WAIEDIIPAPKKPQTLPVVLSPEEVLDFLGCVEHIKHRTILTVQSVVLAKLPRRVRPRAAAEVALSATSASRRNRDLGGERLQRRCTGSAREFRLSSPSALCHDRATF